MKKAIKVVALYILDDKRIYDIIYYGILLTFLIEALLIVK